MRAIKDGVSDGDFAVGDADKDPLRLEDPGYAAIPACYKGGAVSRPHQEEKRCCPGIQASPPAKYQIVK